MAATVSVTINTSTYTALSSTETAASVFIQRGQSVRLAIAASAPSAGTADYISVEGPADGSVEKQVDLHDFGIGGGDEVYALLEYGSTALKVVRGTGSDSNAAATSLAIMDDWDESDRAKVNLIVGQAGVTAGAGAIAANTPRATLASDDPAVASLGVIDDWDESDRAKVNLIVGQAGVAAGAGTAGATTQRMTLASDDPAVSALTTTVAWTNAALVAVSAASATDVLAAATATKGLIVTNESGTETVRIRFDNSAASATVGVPLSPGKSLIWKKGEVPSGKISAYSTNASTINVAYC
jgi:hypothetical protein